MQRTYNHTRLAASAGFFNSALAKHFDAAGREVGCAIRAPRNSGKDLIHYEYVRLRSLRISGFRFPRRLRREIGFSIAERLADGKRQLTHYDTRQDPRGVQNGFSIETDKGAAHFDNRRAEFSYSRDKGRLSTAVVHPKGVLPMPFRAAATYFRYIAGHSR